MDHNEFVYPDDAASFKNALCFHPMFVPPPSAIVTGTAQYCCFGTGWSGTSVPHGRPSFTSEGVPGGLTVSNPGVRPHDSSKNFVRFISE